MRTWYFACSLAAAPVALASTCLPEAIPANQRRNITVDGVSMPIGIFLNDWDSGYLTANLWSIIVQEKFGYNVRRSGTSSGVRDSLYALGSCTTKQDPITKTKTTTCGLPAGRHHVTLEIWDSYTPWTVSWLANNFPKAAPVNLGNVGYSGQEGLWVLGNTQSAAKTAEGLHLEYYGSYNASWHNLSQYFAKGSDFNASLLLNCNPYKFDPANGAPYPAITGDQGGVSWNPDGTFYRACWEGKWWFSPKCRSNPDQCIPVITGDYDWGTANFMQWSTYYDIPIRIGVAKDWNTYTSAASVGKGPLLYWWFPDTTFLASNPQLVVFPPNDPTEYNNLTYKTAMPSDPIWKAVAPKLRSIAPQVVQFTQRINIPNQMILGMLKAKISLTQSWTPAWDAACNWLRANRAIWEAWIPTATECTAGYGLVNAQGDFVNNISSAVSCDRCQPGRYSTQLLGSGTSVCTVCDPGSFSDAFASTECSLCSPGTFAAPPVTQGVAFSAQTGMTSCTRCAKGQYQANWGNSSCTSCSGVLAGSTTSGTGAISSAECTCPEGWYLLQPSNTTSSCRPCDEGLLCPGGLGSPLQAQGYFARSFSYGSNQALTAPPQMVLCGLSTCPQGLPLGQCPPKLNGLGCARCDAYSHWDGQNCADCKRGASMAVGFTLFVLVAFFLSIFLGRTGQGGLKRMANDRATLAVTIGLTIHVFQTLVVFRTVPLVWVQPLSAFQVAFKAIVDFFSPNCLFGITQPTIQYLLVLLALPIFTLLIWIGLGIQRLWGRHVDRFTVANATGTVVVVFNLALLMSAVFPFQCTKNPDQSSTVTGMRGVTCWTTSDHAAMIGLSVSGIICYIVLPMAIVIWATIVYPVMLVRRGGIQFLHRFEFLFTLFTPERYYYGIVYMLRNLALAIIPVVLQQYQTLSGICMSAVLVTMAVLQTKHFPWRSNTINYVYTGQLMGLVFVLVACQIAAQKSSNDEEGIQIFVFTVIGIGAFFLLSLILFLLRRALNRDKRYQIFISHHKGGASVLARWLKIEFGDRVMGEIFLDSDNLTRLDSLFDIVANDTKNIVLLLTKETLTRIWCAGEIACAVENKVTIVPVVCDDFEPITDAFLENLEMTWTQPEKESIAALGISINKVREAYKVLRDLPTIPFSRAGELEDQEPTLKAIIEGCSGLYRRTTFFHSWSFGAEATSPFIALIGDSREAEAQALQVVLHRLLQQEMKVDVRVVKQGGDMTHAKCVVVVLTKDALTDPKVAALMTVQGAQLPWVPLIADAAFLIPDAAFYQDLLAGNIMDQDSLPVPLAAVESAYKHLFKALALRISPKGSQQIIHSEVEQIGQRLEGFLKMDASAVSGYALSESFNDARAAGAADQEQGSERDSDAGNQHPASEVAGISDLGVSL